MDLPELENIPVAGIPDIFYSTDSKEPFKECMICSTPLYEGAIDYIIEKAFRNYRGSNVRDVVYEFAMCHECMQKLYETYSEQSRKRLEEFLLNNTNLSSRRERLIEKEVFEINDWVGTCAVTGKPMDECETFQISGQFFGSLMAYTYIPWMISDEAADQMVALLSTETLGDIDDFYNKYIDLTSDFGKFFSKKKKPVPLF